MPDPRTEKPGLLTWAVLLARWMEFARSSAALPRDGAWGALRASVPDLIALQALCLALRDLEMLDAQERALGLDRAALLIEKHAQAIQKRAWPQGVPPALLKLIQEARNLWREKSGKPQPGQAGDREKQPG